MWTINAAKKKDDEVIPGTSKWIRSEALTLHDQMLTDLEQIAYDVAADFAWIDEQMKEILDSKELNPRLLLESPYKLRTVDSPVSKLRTEALSTLKSPMKSDLSSLSPLRTRSNLNEEAKLIAPENFRLFQSPSRKRLSQTEPNEHSFIKSSTPFTNKVQPTQPAIDTANVQPPLDLISPVHAIEDPAFSSTPAAKVALTSKPKLLPTESKQSPLRQQAAAVHIQSPENEKQTDLTPKENQTEEMATQAATESTITNAPPLTSEFNNGDSDSVKEPSNDRNKLKSTAGQAEEFADVNDNSLQAIRAAIRKNIMRKSSVKLAVNQASDSESSYRSAVADKSEDLSKEPVRDKSKLEELPTSASTMKSAKSGISTSVRKSSFNEDKTFHSTPVKQKYSQRESQGFGLMSHNIGGLSTKAKENVTQTVNAKSTSSKESSSESKGKSTSPTLFTKTLFPATSDVSSVPSSNPTLNLSPITRNKQERPAAAASIKKPLTLKRSQTELTKTQATDLSPSRNQKTNSHKLSFSPLSDLFASVGTALRSVGRPTRPITTSLLDDKEDDGAPNKKIFANVSRNIDFLEETSKISPHKPPKTTSTFKRSAIFSDLEDIFQTKTDKESTKDDHHEVSISELAEGGNKEEDDEEDDVFRKSDLKLSPVRSIWGPPSRNPPSSTRQSQVLNSPVKKSPTRPAPPRVSDTKFVSDMKAKMTLAPPPAQPALQQQHSLTRSLTRVSLTSYGNGEQRTNQPPRKSYIKSGGLTSIPLDGKPRARPASMTFNESHNPTSKRAQIEEHATTYQSTRKLTNISLSKTNHQQAQYQKSMELKRRSLEQSQGILSRKASRISQEAHKENKPLTKNTKFNSSKPLLGKSLTKTALPTSYADNKEKRTTFSKISPTVATNGAKRITTTNLTPPSITKPNNTKTTTTTTTQDKPVDLPEIFSGSEAEEDNSVLLSWAESPYLRQQLHMQQRTVDPDKVFGEILPLNMEEIFGSASAKAKLTKRKSSTKVAK